MKSIVILGNRSFIGKSLSIRLSKNNRIYNFNSENCNLLDYKSIEKSLLSIKNIDVIILCSAITRLTRNDINSMENNIRMSINLAKFIEKIHIKQLIFLSTIDVYGNIKKIYNEALPLNPEDYYSNSKAISELILTQSCRKNNIKIFIPRLSGVFGPGDEDKSTIYTLTTSIINEQKVTLYNEGKDYRDFIFIDFLLDILEKSIKIEFNGTLNIATGKSYQIKDISKMIFEILEKDVVINNIALEKIERNNTIKFDITNLKKSKLLGEILDIKIYLEYYINYLNKKVY